MTQEPRPRPTSSRFLVHAGISRVRRWPPLRAGLPGVLRPRLVRLCAILPLVAAAACGGDSDAAPGHAPEDDTDWSVVIFAPPEQDAFWERLQALCGRAFPGRLALEPPGDDMLAGAGQLVAHFRECDFDEMRIPFHVEHEVRATWDRSRTWVLSRSDEGLDLRHDHRMRHGSEDASNWYGGWTTNAGSPERQDFIRFEGEQDASVRGWRMEIEPGVRFSYGTIRDWEWTWRVDFDLSRTVPPPPAPWGYGEAGR